MANHISIPAREYCCGCGACVSACPTDGPSVTLVSDWQGLYPVVDETTCTSCGRCEAVCPIVHPPTHADHLQRPRAYAGWTLDPIRRRESSSGGVFSELAQSVIERGGVVYGAAYTEDLHGVEHVEVSTLDGLGRLRGSKYVLSRATRALSGLRQNLAGGKEVLFSGTPCQTAALANLVGQRLGSRLLTTVDVVCHGVPSPPIFSKYVDEQEERFGSPMIRHNFRDKRHGWNLMHVSQEFANHQKYDCWNWGDAYALGFFSNVTLQSACYSCRFLGFPRQADITLADFWGVRKRYPGLDDNSGTSLVVINSARGEDLIGGSKNRLHMAECDLGFAVAHNSYFLQSAQVPSHRAELLTRMELESLASMQRDFVSPLFLAKRRTARLVHRGQWMLRDLARRRPRVETTGKADRASGTARKVR